MKILYAIQATGNGHISRAMELLPYLENYGSVDLFLSGANSTLSLDAPVKYRSRGLSLFYTCDGKLDYWAMFRHSAPWRIFRDVKELPVEKYNLVINDFDCITSMACALKKVPSVHFGHQASFLSENTPRPERRSRIGEWILRHYARGSQHIGLHFQPYDDFILSPVIKEEIIQGEASNKGHITVYLPSYCDEQLLAALKPLTDWTFEVFSFQVKEVEEHAHIRLIPVNRRAFNRSLLSCYGIITGGGFETPAEALFLRKKIMVMPIRGQYEQLCNAAALQKLGVPVIKKLDDDFPGQVRSWAEDSFVPEVRYEHSTGSIVDTLIRRCSSLRYELDIPYPEWIFN